MHKRLLKRYNEDGPERLGFVLTRGRVVELVNAHDDPEFGAQFFSEDLFEYLYSGKHETVATWHTHPSKTSNLSGEDYVAFRNHPQIKHYVIGNDGVTEYYIDEQRVVRRG